MGLKNYSLLLSKKYHLKQNRHVIILSFYYFLFIVSFYVLFPSEILKAEELTEPQTSHIKLSLEQAIQLSLRQNRSLLIESSNKQNAYYSLDSALSDFDIQIFPNSSLVSDDGDNYANAGITIEKKFHTGISTYVSPEIRFGSDEGDLGVNFNIEVPLFQGRGRFYNLDSVNKAEYNLETTKRSFHSLKVALVVDTVSNVYDIIQLERSTDIFRDQIKRLKAHSKSAQIKQNVGLSNAIDQYRAEIRMKDAEDRLSNTIESLNNVRDRLKILLAIPLETSIDVIAPINYEKIEVSLQKSIDVALENRVEIQQANEDIKENERLLKIARHDLRPEINLVLGYESFGSFSNGLKHINFGEDNFTAQLVGSTDWKRTKEKNVYSQIKLALDNSKYQYKSIIENISREVRQRYKALFEIQERLSIRRKQIHQAKGKLALAKIQYNHGMADNFEVIEAESELGDARLNAVFAQIDYIVGTYKLRSAMGTLIKF